MKYSELTIHEKINYKSSLLNHTNFNKSKIFERILTDEIKILESRIGSSFGMTIKNQFKAKGFTFYEYKKTKK
jgi:ribosomal protein S18